MEKADLRNRLKQARLKLSAAERTNASRAICERLKQSMDWSSVKSVHYFEPLHYMNEVDLGELVVWLEGEHRHIQLFTPKKIKGQWEMVSIKDGLAPEQFEVIIVPMLGFDRELNRIGYGGGYYDKFLATQPKAKKIGVCFELGIVEQIPAESHDVPLDMVITERTLYKNS